MENKPKIHDDIHDWIDALENQILFNGKEETKFLISEIFKHANSKGLIEDNLKV